MRKQNFTKRNLRGKQIKERRVISKLCNLGMLVGFLILLFNMGPSIPMPEDTRIVPDMTTANCIWSVIGGIICFGSMGLKTIIVKDPNVKSAWGRR